MLIGSRSLVFMLALAGCTKSIPLPGSGNSNGDMTSSGDAAQVVMSQCPAPPVITPSQVPSTGYLPLEKVDLQYPVDGDTVHFNFLGKGEFPVRFLQINTEESHGAETTQFGIDTAAAVEAMMAGPHLFQVAVKAKTNMPTEAAPDAFGRLLAFVFMDGELLQTRIVREGWSAYYVEFGCAPDPIHTSLLYAEAEANAAKRGIWAPGHPTNYQTVFKDWIGNKTCRPNPYSAKYCN